MGGAIKWQFNWKSGGRSWNRYPNRIASHCRFRRQASPPGTGEVSAPVRSPAASGESSRPAGGQRQESREENLDVVESLRRSRIKLIVTRHEQAVAFIAATHGRLTGKPGVCLATLGPGAVNLTTGAAPNKRT
jgi:hypothetical protein